tara:strand:+ start:3527 stop:4564 length:1038 start_codon:yes stop_codon:yes gene_type:complete
VIVQQIPLSWATRQAAAAVANGLSLDRLFDRALITPKFGDDRDRISPLQLTLFQAVLVSETNDSTHLMLRARIDPHTGPLGFRILFSSANLGDGLRALARFYEMASCAIQLQLSTEGDYAFLALHAEDDGTGGILQEDIQLVYLYLGLTSFLGRPFPVSWLITRDTGHFNLGSTHYAMGSPVRLGNCSGLAFPKALLSSQPPAIRIDEFLWRPIQSALLLMEKQSPVDLPSLGVNNRDLQVDTLAAELNMAPSTFRRMMTQNGASFRKVRERALLDATINLLKTQSWCVEAIAAELGYSDARSLRRFVKRATGRTPSELREELGLAVPPAKLYARFKETIGSLPH